MKQKLSRASKRALDELVEKAKNLGWLEDHGSPVVVKEAHEQFTKAHARLQRRLLKLELEREREQQP